MKTMRFIAGKALAIGIALILVHVRVRAVVPVFDDAERWQRLADAIGGLSASGASTAPASLQDQLSHPSRVPIRLARPGRSHLKAESVYDRAAASVVGVASVYKCGHCTRWHNAGNASGWVIGTRGEIASNYHVFAEARGTNHVGVGIITHDGRVFPVREILWSDRDRDVAIVRTEATGLVPLALELDEPVGRPVSVISHPGGNLFTLTQGHVARYMRSAVDKNARPVDWMCITADYAVGSSGGPVFNGQGAVVGMVSRTHSIAADPNHAVTIRMVMKLTVPASSILDVLKSR